MKIAAYTYFLYNTLHTCMFITLSYPLQTGVGYFQLASVFKVQRYDTRMDGYCIVRACSLFICNCIPFIVNSALNCDHYQSLKQQ